MLLPGAVVADRFLSLLTLQLIALRSLTDVGLLASLLVLVATLCLLPDSLLTGAILARSFDAGITLWTDLLLTLFDLCAGCLIPLRSRLANEVAACFAWCLASGLGLWLLCGGLLTIVARAAFATRFVLLLLVVTAAATFLRDGA